MFHSTYLHRLGANMKRSILIPVLAVFVVMSAALGYVGFVASSYPTSHGNFIFANVPFQGPRSPGVHANRAGLTLIEERDLAGHRASYYELSVSDGNGHEIGSVRFAPEVVGGSYDLQKHGKLQWASDGSSVSIRIGAFSYTYDVPRQAAAS
jgi:hypothetical protein